MKNLEITKKCEDALKYKDINLNYEWLKRNNFIKLEVREEFNVTTLKREIVEVIITDVNNNKIILTDSNIDDFINNSNI